MTGYCVHVTKFVREAFLDPEKALLRKLIELCRINKVDLVETRDKILLHFCVYVYYLHDIYKFMLILTSHIISCSFCNCRLFSMLNNSTKFNGKIRILIKEHVCFILMSLESK